MSLRLWSGCHLLQATSVPLCVVEALRRAGRKLRHLQPRQQRLLKCLPRGASLPSLAFHRCALAGCLRFLQRAAALWRSCLASWQASGGCYPGWLASRGGPPPPSREGWLLPPVPSRPACSGSLMRPRAPCHLPCSASCEQAKLSKSTAPARAEAADAAASAAGA